MRKPAKNNTLRNGIGWTLAAAIGAAVFVDSITGPAPVHENDPHAEVVRPTLMKLRIEGNNAYLDGCFRGITAARNADNKSWDTKNSHTFGTLAMKQVGDKWSLDYTTADGTGHRNDLPLTQLGAIETYKNDDKTWDPAVYSEPINGVQRKIICTETLHNPVDPGLNGQFFTVIRDGERNHDNDGFGNTESGTGPYNETTKLYTGTSSAVHRTMLNGHLVEAKTIKLLQN